MATTRSRPRLHADWLPPAPTPAPSHLPHIHPPAPDGGPPLRDGDRTDDGDGGSTRRARSPLWGASECANTLTDPAELAALEDRELRTVLPFAPDGRSTQLAHTAYPLRHRIYALYCEGRSFTAIARTLRLDRGTVARHVHAIEATLLAEQRESSLAQLRLRAVEAQHAILAAAWDALAFEEAQERDYEQQRETDRVQDGHYTALPGRSRRAQLLGIAARAARTAAQLQGLFTPAALQAALQSAGMSVAESTESCGLPAVIPATPPAVNAESATTDLAVSCGMLAASTAPSAPAPNVTGLPVELNSTACLPTTPPAPANPAVSCGTSAAVAPLVAVREPGGHPASRHYPANSIRGLVPTAATLPM